jgi:hypothetical protein
MTYLDEIAAEIRTRVPSELLPGEDTDSLFRLYAVLARAKGARVTADDVHDAWSAWMADRNPTHPSLRPFDQLDDVTRAADEPFVAAIRAAASDTRA